MAAMTGKRRRLWPAGVASILVLGTGVFLFFQDLGTAAKYAGIGSFIIGLVGAGMTATALFITLRNDPQSSDSNQAGEPSSGSTATSSATSTERGQAKLNINEVKIRKSTVA